MGGGGGGAPPHFISFPITLLQPLQGHSDKYKLKNSAGTHWLVLHTFYYFYMTDYPLPSTPSPHLYKHWSNCEGHHHFREQYKNKAGNEIQQMFVSSILFLFFYLLRKEHMFTVHSSRMLTKWNKPLMSSKQWHQVCVVNNYNKCKSRTLERLQRVPGHQEKNVSPDEKAKKVTLTF